MDHPREHSLAAGGGRLLSERGLRASLVLSLDPPAACPAGEPDQGSWRPIPDTASLDSHFARRLDRQDFAGMTWMNRYRDIHYQPARIFPWCRSVLPVALGDRHFRLPDALDPAPASRWGTAGRIARFARGEDYHRVLGQGLQSLLGQLLGHFPTHQFKPWVDAHPLDEVQLAQWAGLGFRGRNGLLISPVHGSRQALGLVLASVPAWELAQVLDLDPPQGESGCPPACRRCIEACPGGALAAREGDMDCGRCLSWLGIEHRGEIDPRLWPLFGDRLYGCDTCQDVCPFNREADAWGPGPGPDGRTPDSPGVWDVGILLEAGAQGKMPADMGAWGRAGHEGLLRNACIVAANSGNRALRGPLEALVASDVSGLVKRHAAWALEILKNAGK